MVVQRSGSRPELASGVTVEPVGGAIDLRRVRSGTRGAGGVEDDRLVARLRDLDDHVSVLESFEVAPPAAARGATARDAASKVVVTAPVDGGVTLLLVRDEGTGLWQWRQPDSVGASRGGAPTRFTVPLTAEAAGQRGITGALVGRALRFVVCHLGDQLIRKGSARLAEMFEDRYRQGGLRWFRTDDHTSPKPEAADQLGVDDVRTLGAGRSLLLLHGAMGLAHTTFPLGDHLLERLCAAYGDRVWAYDHHTLSMSPDENAAALVSALSALGATKLDVDIIAHDRGGLVARELVERTPAKSPLAVSSVLFVATPNAGTPLCDVKHLDKLVNRYTNLLALVPDNPFTDALDAVVTVAASLAVKAADSLVGLKAMDPTSAYLERLNARRPPSEVTYRAICSNYEPDPGDEKLARRLRNLATDHVFGRKPNDLIVPTASTYSVGDTVDLVPVADRFEFSPSQAVDHNGFWDRDELDEQLQQWLHIAPAPPRARRDRGPATGSVARRRDAIVGPVQDVTIEAVHGSVEMARFDVLVGHFLGTPLEGAEGFLDERLDRQLTEWAMLNQYPEAIGTSRYVRAVPNGAERRGFPQGAIVVGLDRPGELTREKLTATVSAALVERAIEELQRRLAGALPSREPPTILHFSSVPIGTSAVGAISVASCVTGLVDGVLAANDQLYRHVEPRRGERAWDHVRIGGLEIIEVAEDKAELVAHEVSRVADGVQVAPGVHSHLVPASRLLSPRDGAIPRRRQSEEAVGEWQRIIIRDPDREDRERRVLAGEKETGASVLEFTAVGRRARADRTLVTIDEAAVASLIERATVEASPGSQVGNTLYELLLPTVLKSDLARIENVQLIVDEHTADFPWEALTTRGRRPDRADDRGLALRGGLLRQFREYEGVRNDIRTPVGNNVLVIGNPPAGEGFATLSGARHEAEAVVELFRRTDAFDTSFAVEELIWDEARQPLVRDERGTLSPGRGASPAESAGQQVLDVLFARDWRIVHIASHGRFDPDDSSKSGAVIDERITLTGNVVRQLPVVPELVFLNCCHLGQISEGRTETNHPNRLAASVARELMRIGVRAVVVAGWAVDDEPAQLFAQTFYNQLLGGELLGTAVRLGRKLLYERFTESMTWAAYQCYGDPGYRLVSKPRSLRRPPFDYVSQAELRRRIQTIKVLAGKIGVPGFAELDGYGGQLVDELTELHGLLSGWRTSLVLADMGLAFKELGRYDLAVGCLREAWQHKDASALPVTVLEQLGNCEIRLAERRWRADPDQDQATAIDTIGDEHLTIADLIDDAQRHLEQARALGDTGERLALLGSFHKKAGVMAGAGADRQAHLEQACERYEAAHRLHLVSQRPAGDADSWPAEVKSYYALNWLQLSKLAGIRLNRREVEATLAAVEGGGRLQVTTDGRLDRKSPPAVTAEDEGEEEDFWSRSCFGDLALTRYTLRMRGSAAHDVEQAYAHAFQLRSSRNNRDSVVDHLGDLAALAGDADLDAIAHRLGGEADAPVPPPALTSAVPARAARSSARASGRSQIVVEALPVAHGDSLVVAYGDGSHRMLIDGGPAHRYEAALHTHLKSLPADRRHFELFVVTHIDADHIDGSVILLQELDALGVEVDEVWFNGWPQLATRGATQGEFLDALLPVARWNTRFGGKAVALGSDGGLPDPVTLPGGAVLTLLSPDQGGLRKLAGSWQKAVHDAGATPGDETTFRQRLAERKIYQPPSSRGRTVRLGGDNAVANGSSIAFLFEDGDSSCLFTGDAYADVLTASLQRLAAQRGVERVPVGLMKLSHHGSQQNISPELLKAIDCRRFLISTNGDIFEHPDPSSIELLANVVGDCEVIFNYTNPTVNRWEKVLTSALRAKIDAVYPLDGEITTVTV